jgi:hypothetical protein
MKGPITRRAIAEEVCSTAPDEFWAFGDIHEAKIAYLMREVRTYMNEPLPAHIAEKLVVPEDCREAMQKLPRYICVSPRGGRGAEHVMSWMATVSDWERNLELKQMVTAYAQKSVDEAEEILQLLRRLKARSLSDLAR